MRLATLAKETAKWLIKRSIRLRWPLRKKSPFDPEGIRSILIPGFSPLGLGDLLMDTPALRAIRKRFPEARITLVTDSPVLDGNPSVDEIVRIPRKPFAYRRILPSLRGKHDLVVVLNRNPFESLFALALKPKHIVGYVGGWRPVADFPLPKGRERFARRFSPQDHFYEMGIRVARLLGAEEPAWDLDPVAFGEEHARRVGKMLGGLRGALRKGEMGRERTVKERKGRLVAISPRVLWRSRTWPGGRYRELIERLLADGHDVVITGGPQDRGYNSTLAAAFAESRHVVDLTGNISLQELAALFTTADLAVMGDCGPMHIAIGVRCPLVTFWGPTDPATRLPPARIGKDIVALYHPEHPDAANYRMEHDPGGEAIEAISVEEAYTAVSAQLKPREIGKRKRTSR